MMPLVGNDSFHLWWWWRFCAWLTWTTLYSPYQITCCCCCCCSARRRWVIVLNCTGMKRSLVDRDHTMCIAIACTWMSARIYSNAQVFNIFVIAADDMLAALPNNRNSMRWWWMWLRHHCLFLVSRWWTLLLLLLMVGFTFDPMTDDLFGCGVGSVDSVVGGERE